MTLSEDQLTIQEVMNDYGHARAYLRYDGYASHGRRAVGFVIVNADCDGNC